MTQPWGQRLIKHIFFQDEKYNVTWHLAEPQPAWQTPTGYVHTVRAGDEGVVCGAREIREHEGGSFSTRYCFLSNAMYHRANFQGEQWDERHGQHLEMIFLLFAVSET